MVTVEIDVSGVAELMRGIQNALVGIGGDGDATKLVRSESRLLAQEISQELGPRTVDKGIRKIKRDVGKHMAAPMIFQDTSKINGTNDIDWLSAGKNFLTGTAKANNLLSADVDTAYAALRADQQSKPEGRGLRYGILGKRGRKTVTTIDRLVVSKGVFKALIERLSQRVGRRRATFAETADKLEPDKSKAPAWVKKHFGTQDDRTMLNPAGLSNAADPVVEFGSSAPGITDAVSADFIRKAVKVREKKMLKKLDLILSGYAHQANAGKRPTKGFQPSP